MSEFELDFLAVKVHSAKNWARKLLTERHWFELELCFRM